MPKWGQNPLQSEIEAAWASGEPDLDLFRRFLALVESGEIRAAEPDPASVTGWRANAWVKQGILLGFRWGSLVEMSPWGDQKFFDKSTYPLQALNLDRGVRVVPGGSAIRSGCYVAQGVTCMPPMYINVGAYVDTGTMVDSHALVGSCAQIGKRVHLSAAAQIGGVLEPVGAIPVVIEDGCLIGGNTGIYEGTIVKANAVVGTGTILNRSTPIYDLVRETIHTATDELPLIVPEGAVVVPGARAVTRGKGVEWGLSLQTPVIVKYRDAGTDDRARLEDWLR